MTLVLQLIIWGGIILAIYTYFGYYNLLRILTRKNKSYVQKSDGDYPYVSIIIAAYNEEKVIAERIRNIQSLEYPSEKIEVLIGSDGSTDGMNKIINGIKDERVNLISFPQQNGKVGVLNKLVPQAQGEIIIFSDANTIFQPDAVKKMVRHFNNPEIGGVCGKLELINSNGDLKGWGESQCWEIESNIKKYEGLLNSTIGANGGIYAIRKSLFTPLDETRQLPDDLLIPLFSTIHGHRFIYDVDARGTEHTTYSIWYDFLRRIRIGSANYQVIRDILPFLSLRNKSIAWSLFSHKVLRWLLPFIFLAVFGSTIALTGSPFYRILLYIEAAFIASACLGLFFTILNKKVQWFYYPYYFVFLNCTLLIGFFRYILGFSSPQWQTKREKTGK